MEAIQTNQGKYAKAYLVPGGPGWKLRNFYLGGGLNQYLKHGEYVKLMDFEHFVALANTAVLKLVELLVGDMNGIMLRGLYMR